MVKLAQSGSLSGLLRASDGSFSPGRVQMLVLTLVTAIHYLLTTLQNPAQLPAIPANLLMVLGGSHLVYLGSKALDVFGPTRNLRDK